MKKFNEFDKKTVESTDDKVLENFTENLEELNENVKNSDKALGMFENVISELDSSLSENFVQKKDVTNFFKSQITSLKDQFENLKNEILSLNDHQKNELLTEVNLVLKNANNVIEKVDSESKIYKEKYFNDTIITEVKLKDIDKKLDNLDYQNVINEISKFKEDVTFFREVAENKLPQQDKKINKINFESEQESNRIKKLITDILLEFEQKIKSNNEEMSNDFTSFKNDVSKLSSIDIEKAKKEFLNNLKEIKVNQLNGDKQLKKTFNEEFKSIKKDIKSADTKINKQINKYKLLDDKTKILMNEVKLVFKDKRLTNIDKKVKFIEDTLKKFNEKTILTENIVNVPADTNKDPLTPLNQNYVTFDQLKKHYQLFINRVQQQLMSVGGGGAVRIDQLDDVDHNSVLNAQNGQALVFITEASGGNNKFEVRTVATSGGGGGTATEIGEATVSGNIIPDTDEVYNLGNATHKFGNLFLSGNTLVIGGLTLRDKGDELEVRDRLDRRLLRGRPGAPVIDLEDFTSANIAEVGKLFFTNLRSRAAISVTPGAAGYTVGTGVITIPGTTNHVTEGTNLFFTDARANAALQSNIDIRLTTANVSELTNLYFTDVRARDALAANIDSKLTIANVAGYHANLESELTTANVSELTNLYYTDGRFDTRFATKDTDDLSEGSSNEYFTQSRARGSISTDAGARAYNSGTGVITIPGTSDHVTEGTTNLFFSNTRANGTISANVQHSMQQHMVVALSGSTDNVFASANVLVLRAPVPMTLYQLPRISVLEAPTGDTIEVGIQVNNSDILSTNLTIDANETTSTTAATPAVLSSTTIADDAEIQFDVNKVGSTLPGKALKLTLYYTVTEV